MLPVPGHVLARPVSGCVTCRFARPERAARWSASRSESSASAAARSSANVVAGSSSASGPVPTGRSHTGASRPCARNMPTSRAPSTMTSLPATCSRARASSSWSSGSGITQRRCSLVPTSVQYAASTWVSRAVGLAAAFAWSSAAASSSLSSTSETQNSNPSWTVTFSCLSVTRSWSRGPAPGGSVRPSDARLVGVDRELQHRPEVAGRVAEVVLDLQPEPQLAAVADHRRGRHRQQRAEGHRLVGALDAQRCGRARHQLAHRDDVALRGQPLERPSDVHAARPALGTVARLVALARAARARLPRTDLTRCRRLGLSGLGPRLLRHAGDATCRAAPARTPGGR